MNEYTLMLQELSTAFPSHLVLLENPNEEFSYIVCVHRGDTNLQQMVSNREAFTLFSELPVITCQKFEALI